MRKAFGAALLLACGSPPPEPALSVVELDIAGIHAGLAAGDFRCSELVAAYLARIEAYDRQGPTLSAIVAVNPQAESRARKADERIARDGIARPLECVPMIVKDNYDTADMPTTAGSASLAASVPPDDAFQVRRIREAGAIVLAKSNMAEFAFSPNESLGSVVPGHTRNPYDPRRVPAGSSGGTAAAVAASFGAVGLGTDTGNSIRGPSSHAALVGIRSTMGITSRDGIVPLNLFRDVGGPMARTVEDAVRVFDVIAGPDPADPATEGFERDEDYRTALDAAPLDGMRIGAVRQLSDVETADPEILALFEAALADLAALGAEIVGPVVIPMLDEERSLWCNPFKAHLEAYLMSLGPDAPVRTARRNRGGRRLPPVHRGTARNGARGRGSAGERLRRRHGGSRRAARRGRGGLRRRRADRARVPHVEQPAADARGSRDSGRKQLVPVVAADRLPCGHRSDGVHGRRTARRAAIARAGAAGGGADPARLRVRAGHAPPPAAADHAGTRAVTA